MKEGLKRLAIYPNVLVMIYNITTFLMLWHKNNEVNLFTLGVIFVHIAGMTYLYFLFKRLKKAHEAEAIRFREELNKITNEIKTSQDGSTIKRQTREDG